MDSKFCWATVLILSILINIANARMAAWNSLSFGPDFEKQWALDELPGNERQIKPRLPLKALADDAMKNGLNRKNCMFSPVQCSLYFNKRSIRSDRYVY